MTIIVKLQGGLGNQLFQYAIGRALAIKLKTEFKIDKTLFDNYKFHAYSLDPFNIIENFATKKEVKRFKRFQVRHKRFCKPYNILFADKDRYIQERQPYFDSEVLEKGPNIYLDGYWQSEKYFKHIKNTLRVELTLKKPLSVVSSKIKNEIESVNAVALHVRRGLFVTHPVFSQVHGSCSLEYYKKALTYICKHVKDPHIFVFSDDHEWARENIKPSCSSTYIEHTDASTDYEDLILMSCCKHFILANSTFGWWGAWLNPSENKIVIGPDKWYKKEKFENKDIFPDSWIKLPN